MARKRGRPKGVLNTRVTPADLLLAEMRESVKLSKQIRGMIQTQVGVVQEGLAKLTPVERLEVVGKLADLLPALNKSIEQAAKYIGVTKGSTDEAVDVDRILREEILG
jgi:hypothetical protein